MDVSALAIATITRARDEAEATSLTDSLDCLERYHIPVYVTDAGSTASFINFLRSENLFHLHPQPVKGVWPQAKHSLAAAFASGAGYILYTEPDKQEFFEQHLPALFDHSLAGDTGILLASRSPQAFATFASFQQMTEATINHCCAELIGKAFDYTYGPFLMRREIVPQLLQLPGDIGWGWRPFAFNIARRLLYNIEAITGDFCCPADQRNDTPSERIYRMQQLEQNIRGLVLSSSVTI